MNVNMADRPVREPAVRGSALERAVDRTTLQSLVAAIEHAQRILGEDLTPARDGIVDFEGAGLALRTIGDWCDRMLAGDDHAGEQVERMTDLMQLQSTVASSERLLHRAELKYHTRSMAIAHEAMALLHDATSTSQLLAIGTGAVCELGFDRAIVSHVKDRAWIPDRIHVVGDPEWAAEILGVGAAHPQSLFPGLPEYDIARRRRPVLVTDVQVREHINRPIADVSKSSSYVAAPLRPNKNVIGFLHADRFYHQGKVSEFDRDLLFLFAEGFGVSLERTSLRSRLDGIHGQLTAAADAWGGTSEPAPDVSDREVVRLRAELAAADDDRLTRREMEVLKLLGSGDTNTEIAERLVIAESTVKSHVKSILRKLGATNRAEAVARWHRTSAS